MTRVMEGVRVLEVAQYTFVPAAGAVLGSVLSGPWWLGPIAVLAAYLVAALLLRRCVSRLGGITGDVLGACVEAATCAALVVLAVA